MRTISRKGPWGSTAGLRKGALLTAVILLSMTCREGSVAAGTAGANESAPQAAQTGPDSSRTSVDWAGSYRGVLPCADCEGIDTTITLSRDLTYVLRSRYLGKSGRVFERRGSFTWDGAGAKIHLEGIGRQEAPADYLVGENRLFQLDLQGNRITGDLADRYVLAKIADPADDELTIWKEFVAAMKAGGFPSDKVRPYDENLREPILGWLKEMREKAAWAEWEKRPEHHRVGEHVHFLIPLTFDGQTATYCLTFLVEGGAWYFRHLEAINIRLDKTGPLPTSTFPDVDEPTKAHIREEAAWSREVRVFNELAALKGKAFAFDFFKDGEGYFLTARTWVPFVEPRRAFVLYACWEQANLRGNAVTLERLDDGEAVVKLSTFFFKLYHVSAHLAQQIPFEDYRTIFESIWEDRARAAGWTLETEYLNEAFPASTCVLRFRRPG